MEHQIVSRALVIAAGVRQERYWEALGMDVGDSEDEVFWTQFLRSLRQRGLTGVRPVVSDAHSGLKRAIRKELQGASWQHCRVHPIRNLLSKVPRGSAEMVAATVRTVFAQRDPDATRIQLRLVADTLRPRVPI